MERVHEFPGGPMNFLMDIGRGLGLCGRLYEFSNESSCGAQT